MTRCLAISSPSSEGPPKARLVAIAGSSALNIIRPSHVASSGWESPFLTQTWPV